MYKYLPIAVLALTPMLGVSAETENDRWNLGDLYATTDAWKADSAKLEDQLKDFAACQGKLGESVKRFHACMDLDADILRRYKRLSTYATQLRDQDTAANIGQHLSMRNFMEELRSSGVETGGPAAFNHSDGRAFARELDRYAAQYKPAAPASLPAPADD